MWGLRGGDSVIIVAVFRVCVCVFVCIRERERLGDFPVVRKKLSSDFKGVSGHAALTQPGVDASSVWPCNFHDKYLSSYLLINLVYFHMHIFLHLHKSL